MHKLEKVVSHEMDIFYFSPGNARMTHHPLKKHIADSWSVSWPMILIMVFEFLINLTDVYIAGRLGTRYQATVGFVTQVYFVFIVIGNALTVGTVSVVSRLHTSGKKEDLKSTIFSISVTVAGAVLLLGVAGLFLTPYFLRFLNVPEALKTLGAPLLAIYALGLGFHYILINTNGILRATGRIRHSLITMLLACVINIGLNVLLVFFTPLGYIGIALSTALAAAAGAAVNTAWIYPRIRGLRKLSRERLRSIFSISWPFGVLQLAWQTGSTLLFLILSELPAHRVEILAGFTNGQRVEAAIYLPAFAFSMASAVVVGNFLGEGRKRDAFRGGLVTASLGVVFITALTVAVVINSGALFALLNDSKAVMAESSRYIYAVMWSEPVMAWAVVMNGALNGAGDTKGVMAIVASSMWLVRLPLAYLLGIALGMGPLAIWWCMNLSICFHAVFITIRYVRGRWVHS